MAKLRTINQPLPLSRIAYEALRDSILTGKLISGEVYNEMAIAKELGISRTPVREALLELSAQGLVSFLPRKGVIVKHYTRRDVEEIFELRKAIELAAVEKIARAFPPHDLSKLEKSLEKQRKAVKERLFVDYLDADRIFHTTFSKLTNNNRLIAISENIRDMIHLMGMRALGAAENRAEEVIAEHEKVIDAVKQGKPVQARRVMEIHLNRSKDAVLEGGGFEAEE
jgi:DNA-binding GntR family transcriptional regulator